MPPSRKRRSAAREDDDQEVQIVQRPRRRAPVSDDEDDEDDNGSNDTPAQDDEANDAEDSMNQLVKKFVRYVLACEFSRTPIRREGIREKVFGKHKRPFKQIFDEAQRVLREKWGMELIELPIREKVTMRERRAAAQKATQGPTSSNAWILGSTLPSEYRIPEIIPPSAVPKASTEAEYTALYSMVIALIFLSGGTIAEAKLQHYLQRLNADVHMGSDTTEAALAKMIKHSYIVKIKEKVQDDETIEYMVGPRGKMEVGELGVKGMVELAYGENAPDDLLTRISKSLGLKVDNRREVEPSEEVSEVQNGESSAAGARRGRGRPRRSAAEDDDE